MIRYNTNSNNLETFVNGSWTNLAGASVGSYLPLAGGTMTGAILEANGAAGTPAYSFSASTGAGIYSPAVNNLSLATAGAQRLNVDQMGNVTVTGNVGIGSQHQRSARCACSVNATTLDSVSERRRSLFAALWSRHFLKMAKPPRLLPALPYSTKAGGNPLLANDIVGEFYRRFPGYGI